MTKSTSIHSFSQWVGGTSLWCGVLLVFGSHSVLLVLWMKDSVDLLELLRSVWKECVVAVWHRLGGGFLFKTRKEIWDSFVFISKHRYVYVEEMCVCVCLCMHWQFCLFPFFRSSSLSFPSLNLSLSLFSFPTCTPLMSPSWFGDGSVSHDAPAPGSGGPVQGWRSFASSSACLSSSSLHRVYKEMRGTTKKESKSRKPVCQITKK